jgi:hypothetical protein
MYVEIEVLRIPVVKGAHGVVLANDGILWNISSMDANESLIKEVVMMQ